MNTRDRLNACEQFEYGEDCAGDCRVACLGQDCLDRMSGECKPNYFKYIPLVLSMLLLPVLTYWCLSTRNIYEFDYGEEGSEVLENSRYDSSVDAWSDEDFLPEADVLMSRPNEDKLSEANT
ncbi:hypothetical protein Btru_014779 [Bulinus truncatus]|nr:hypothetical protein Btru_014779 [Bulinus truncatus]